MKGEPGLTGPPGLPTPPPDELLFGPPGDPGDPGKLYSKFIS